MRLLIPSNLTTNIYFKSNLFFLIQLKSSEVGGFFNFKFRKFVNFAFIFYEYYIFVFLKGESCAIHELSRNRYASSKVGSPKYLSRFEVEIMFYFYSFQKV